MRKPFRYLIPGALRPSNDELWWLKQDLSELRSELHKVVSEVIVIHGTSDKLVPFSNVFFMKTHLVNARSIETVSIENGNHFIPWEEFELIRDKLAAIRLTLQ